MATLSTSGTNRRLQAPHVGRPPALPPSETKDPSSRTSGYLDVTIFSLLDLPYDEKVPLGVRWSVCGTSVWSGPPKQRRPQSKGNSFRFATESSGDTTSPLRLSAPLSGLYRAKLKAEVVYSAQDASQESPTTLLHAEFPLSKLCVNCPKDITLNLKPVAQKAGESTTMIAELDRPPTMTVRLHLRGQYRPQVQTLFRYLQVYLQLIDTTEDQLWDPLYRDVLRPFVLPVLPVGIGLSALPVVTTVVVVSPLVIGISILFFPIVLPLLVIGAGIVAGGFGLMGVLVGSTRRGRALLDRTVLQHSLVQTYVMTSPATQAFLYDTGGDWLPNPVALLRWYVVPDDIWYKLFLSLAVDCIGSLSYLLPVVGESFDGPWAPFQSMLLMAMYQDADQPHLKYVSFAEELLPFTDVLPTATIGWATENMPGLVQEWKDLYGGDSNKENVTVGEKKMADGSGGGTSPRAFGTAKTKSAYQPTEAQKRSILKEMQAHGERLSVNS